MRERLGDGLALGVGPGGEDIDDSLLISTEALHGSSQRRCIFSGVEVRHSHHGRRALGK